MDKTDLPFELIKEIKGFLDEEEGLFLYRTAERAARQGPCLEIGSYCGKSAVYLGMGCKVHQGILFSIDHHRGSEEQQPGQEYFDPALFDQETGRIDTFPFFRKAIEKAGLEETVVPLVCSSPLAARQWATPLSLVFIDGGHSFETAYEDYQNWAGHILPGGYLLIHDIFEDPKDGGQAPFQVYQLAVASGLFQELPRVKTLGVLKRRGEEITDS
ncbi:MAG: class I SAM-dependent methyltransferase [Deltaproteobacteria bacterium]|nr:class I SAM-dependent methyltransferase [Deltaproteobacteria bacterium]